MKRITLAWIFMGLAIAMVFSTLVISMTVDSGVRKEFWDKWLAPTVVGSVILIIVAQILKFVPCREVSQFFIHHDTDADGCGGWITVNVPVMRALTYEKMPRFTKAESDFWWYCRANDNFKFTLTISQGKKMTQEAICRALLNAVTADESIARRVELGF